MVQTDEPARTHAESESRADDRVPLVNARYAGTTFRFQDERNSDAWIATERPVENRQ